jgi:transketolase
MVSEMLVSEMRAAVRRESPVLDERSRYLRRLVIRALEGGGRGHIGSSMSLIEIFRVLFDDVLRYRPAAPLWPERDRCILSKGHGCLALYAILADKGYFPLEELDRFCRRDAVLGGHPERGKIPGVETSTGALGHGFSVGMGVALALRMRRQEGRVFVVLGDGEINEGSNWEAAMSAHKHGLSNLTAIVDYNKVQSAGPTAEILDLEPLADKWRAFGFGVVEVDGHDVAALRRSLRGLPAAPDRPSALICHTVKGGGIPFAENDANWHHKSSIKPDVIAKMYAAVASR